MTWFDRYTGIIRLFGTLTALSACGSATPPDAVAWADSVQSGQRQGPSTPPVVVRSGDTAYVYQSGRCAVIYGERRLDFACGQLIIGLRAGKSSLDVRPLLQAIEATILDYHPSTQSAPWLLVRVPAQTELAAVKRAATDESVTSAAPNFTGPVSLP